MKEKIRLLLADDHAILRTGLKMFFNSQEDLTVVGEAVSGEDAVSKVQALQPDIVLLDISMPGMGGIEAVAAIKKVAPQVRIIMLTMHEGEEYLQQALREGANGYVLKKAADAELLEAIRAVAVNGVFLHPNMTQALIKAIQQEENTNTCRKGIGNLTEREKEVLKLVALGLTNKEIGEELGVSIKTVETHKARIMEKTGCERRSALVRYAKEEGYI